MVHSQRLSAMTSAHPTPLRARPLWSFLKGRLFVLDLPCCCCWSCSGLEQRSGSRIGGGELWIKLEGKIWIVSLVVMGGYLCSEDRGFKPHHRILDGHFLHIFVVKIVIIVWKDENKRERGCGLMAILKKSELFFPKICSTTFLLLKLFFHLSEGGIRTQDLTIMWGERTNHWASIWSQQIRRRQH